MVLGAGGRRGCRGAGCSSSVIRMASTLTERCLAATPGGSCCCRISRCTSGTSTLVMSAPGNRRPPSNSVGGCQCTGSSEIPCSARNVSAYSSRAALSSGVSRVGNRASDAAAAASSGSSGLAKAGRVLRRSRRYRRAVDAPSGRVPEQRQIRDHAVSGSMPV